MSDSNPASKAGSQAHPSAQGRGPAPRGRRPHKPRQQQQQQQQGSAANAVGTASAGGGGDDGAASADKNKPRPSSAGTAGAGKKHPPRRRQKGDETGVPATSKGNRNNRRSNPSSSAVSAASAPQTAAPVTVNTQSVDSSVAAAPVHTAAVAASPSGTDRAPYGRSILAEVMSMLTVSPGSTGPSVGTATGTSASTPAAAAAPRSGAVNHDIQVQPGRWVDSTSAPQLAVHGVPDAWSSSAAAAAVATTQARPVQSHFGPPQAALMVPAVEPAVPASAFAGFLSQLRSQANASPPVPQHLMLSGAAAAAVPAARPAVDLPYGNVVPAGAGVNGVPMMAHWSQHQQQQHHHHQQQQPSWEANAAWGDRGVPGVFNQPSWPLHAALAAAAGPQLQSRQQPFTNSVMHQQPSSDMSHQGAPHLLQSYHQPQHLQHRLQPGGWPGVATSSANAGQDIELRRGAPPPGFGLPPGFTAGASPSPPPGVMALQQSAVMQPPPQLYPALASDPRAPFWQQPHQQQQHQQASQARFGQLPQQPLGAQPTSMEHARQLHTQQQQQQVGTNSSAMHSSMGRASSPAVEHAPAGSMQQQQYAGRVQQQQQQQQQSQTSGQPMSVHYRDPTHAHALNGVAGTAGSGPAPRKAEKNGRPKPHRMPNVHAREKLHRQVAEFLKQTLPDGAVLTLRQRIQTYLSGRLHQLLPGSRLEVFGSTVSGLITRASDMDVTIITEIPESIHAETAVLAAQHELDKAAAEKEAAGRLDAQLAADPARTSVNVSGQQLQYGDGMASSPAFGPVAAPGSSEHKAGGAEENRLPDKPLTVEGVLVEKIAEIFKSDPQLESVLPLPRARVPIVKLKVRCDAFLDGFAGAAASEALSIGVDIGINNLLAVRNSRLIGDYVSIDPRLRELCFIIKHWAHQRKVNDPYRGTLSSYAYVLMLIAFLQTRSPPILPCLQRWGPATARQTVIIRDFDCSYFTDVASLRGFGSQNTEGLSTLLVEFFRLWAHDFDYHNSVVSIRVGGYITKEDKQWTQSVGRDRHWVSIEDPFEVSHDLGRVCDRAALREIRGEFMRAFRILCETGDLRELCTPYTQEWRGA